MATRDPLHPPPVRNAGASYLRAIRAGFATHRTKQLRPVTSGGAELMIAQIKAVCESYREDTLAYDRAMKALQSAPWAYSMGWAPPEKPNREVYLARLKALDVPADSAQRYLDGALRSRRRK